MNGQELRLEAPEVITVDGAAQLLSPERARFWRAIGIEHCLELKNARVEMRSDVASLETR
jgi:hypothetical protein